ncbi:MULTISPECIES: hypothetical protein [unclassified Sinorhizobium]|uniref:hypothetical protein n=1 Tax=unclassified Sinorhizobium TaxID=2613772 RepID=UPI003526192F
MTTLPAALSTLNRQIGALSEQLRPATEDQVARSVRSLLAAGLALPSAMQAGKAPEIYAFALAGVAAHGLRRATEKIIRGEYEINRAFVPTPPEFAALARSEARAVREDIARLRERKAMLEEAGRPRAKTDEGQLDRIRALYRQFSAANSQAKAFERHRPPQEALTPEEAAYWAGIADLSDAPTISAEQAAFRRRVAAVIVGPKTVETETMKGK